MANTSAAASWLGYKIQEYRLVERLLKANKSHELSFEFLDDVSEKTDSELILEQDKVSVTKRNILSNKSKDFWKTISNWIDLIKASRIDEAKTVFVLFTNKEHSSDVLALLCQANSLDDSKEAYSKMIKLVENPADNIKQYVENFVNMDDRKLTLIENFRYIYGSGSAQKDLLATYLSINTSVEDNATNILHEILGWTTDIARELAEQKKPIVIRASAFGTRLGKIESKYRQKGILEFICERAADDDDVVTELTQKHNYLKQLEIIGIDQSHIEEAAIAKLEAKDAVSKWTISGHVQESSYQIYSDSLARKWNQQKTITFLEHKNLESDEKGQILYIECLQKSESIKLENRFVDSFFSRGSYQSLADKDHVGWHPDYKTLLIKDNDDN
jgi:hypothetical protein